MGFCLIHEKRFAIRARVTHTAHWAVGKMLMEGSRGGGDFAARAIHCP